MNHFYESSTHPSDAFVLWITAVLLAILCTVPAFRALADTVQQQDESTTVIIPNSSSRDYTALLTYIFNTDENQIDAEAAQYIQDVDDYRARIARGIVENTDLVTALHALADNLPDDLAEPYRDRIRDMSRTADQHTANIIRYVNSDTFLITAVANEYNLKQYTFLEKLTRLLGQATTVDNLSDLRQDSYNLRISLAKLYEKMHSFIYSHPA